MSQTIDIRTSTIICVDADGDEHTIEVVKAYERRRTFDGTFIFPHPWAYFWNGRRVHSVRTDVFNLPFIGHVIRKFT